MEPAIGRTPGKLSIDQNGLARYVIKVDVPSGIGHGNEPDLSLAYAQGSPNGVVGYGWILSGLSTIRCAQASMPFDDPNVPKDYDRTTLRYALDGQELLPINGPQGAANTLYTTEVNEYERRISHSGSGFLVLGQAGATTEYGTSPDSCVLSSDRSIIKEWRMKRQVDIHGNCVTYNYVQTPVIPSSTPSGLLGNLNTSYIESIVYTSNEKTGFKGMHQIFFDYKPRSDPVVHTVLGDKVVTGLLLTAIRIMVNTSPTPTLIRSYELEYVISPTTGSSCLHKVWESSQYRDLKNLIPTEFTYTSMSGNETHYELDREGIQTLHESVDNVSLIPIDVTGRALTDMVCLRYQKDSQTLSLKTFLASCQRGSQSVKVLWEQSNGASAEASLPRFPLGEGFPRPSLLTADINGDGRNDVIIPFQQSSGLMGFSLSQSTGTGFLDHQVKETSFEWTKESVFIASDVNGDGRSDVIQIFPDQGRLAFRVFTTVTEQGLATLEDARPISTPHEFGHTIQWLQVQTQRNGAKNLVRIHARDNADSLDYTDLYATTFTLEETANQDSDTRSGKESRLGTFENEDAGRVSIVACDINGDGVQDLVLCLVKPSGGGEMMDWNFTLTTMLNDGNGAFLKHGTPFETKYSIPLNQMPTKKPNFYTQLRNCSDYPTLAYVFQEGDSKDFVSLNFQAMCSGFVKAPQFQKIANYTDLPADQDWSITSADLSGYGLADWLVYSLKNENFTICPIYNRGGLVDHLASARDPMGLLSEIEYKPMTDPQVYNSGIAWNEYAPSAQQSQYTLLAAPSYVVSNIKTTNDPSINAVPYYTKIEKSYRQAVVEVRGRGWQGFQNVISYDTMSDTTTIESYTQQWPLSGQLSGTTIASGKPNACQVLQVETTVYEARAIKLGSWTTFRPLKSSQRLDAYDVGRIARSVGNNFTYDPSGNVVLNHAWSSSVQPLYTRIAYHMFMDLIALPIRKKVSSQPSNQNLDIYEAGDYSLMHSDYDTESGLLKTISHWSTDARAFSTTSYQFDQYGNEIQSVDSVGLQISTEFDNLYHSLPVRRTETGPGVHLVRLAAYDAMTCAMVVVEDADGVAKYMLADAWGRCQKVRKRATSTDKDGLQTARDFLGDIKIVVGDTSFLQRALELPTVPDQSFSLMSGLSKTKHHYLYAQHATYYNASDEGKSETIEVVDCVGSVRKKSVKNGHYESSWRYTEDDARGCRTVESFPYCPTDAGTSDTIDIFDWTPQPKECVISTYDSLRRLVTQTKASHTDDSTTVVMHRSYAAGGAKQITTIAQERSGLESAILTTMAEHFLNIDSEDRLTKKVDEAGQETLYDYDLLGRLIKITDPAGKTEIREYNSGNKITKTDDSHRNVVTRSYNLGNHLTQSIDAMGQKIVYLRDAKGRVLEQRGDDGRTTSYEYDQSGREWVTSIRTTASSSTNFVESRFDYEHDERGRQTKQTLTFEGLDPFLIRFSYDWQDQITQKVLPDRSAITRTFSGPLLASTSMKGDNWKVSADYQKYNPGNKPEKWTINNHGSVSQSFANEVKYDKMCFPVSHTLNFGSTGLQNHYLFNDLNQLRRVHEFGTGETTDYQYKSGRLVSYQNNSNDAHVYEYDLAGNLTKSNDVQMKSEGSSLHGTRNGGKHFSIQYDRCGRMTERSTLQSQFAFSYNSFGKMCTMVNKNSSTGETTEILCDHHGHTLLKRQPDGTREISIDPSYSVSIRTDGSHQIQRKWNGQDRVLATIRSEIPASKSQEQVSVNLYYTDTKGNVTHIYTGDGALSQRLRYDPFGAVLEPDQLEPHEKEVTFESNNLDLSTMMYDFAARWYDPLCGRFTTADDILDEKSAKQWDGINRHAFENNDPINHIDPTGHWTWSAVTGLVVGGLLVIAAVVLTVMTAGAAAPLAVILAGALTGALMGGGVSAITYSLEHKNETDPGKFWGGYCVSLGTGMLVGAISGAFTAGIGCASAAKVGATAAGRLIGSASSTTWTSVARVAMSVGTHALTGGLSNMLNQIGANLIERDIYGRTDVDWDTGLGTAFGMGLLTGTATHVGGKWWSTGGKEFLKGTLKTLIQDRPLVLTEIVLAVVAVVTIASQPQWVKFTDDYGYVDKPDKRKKK